MLHPKSRLVVRLAPVAMLLWAFAAHAAGENDLYRAQAIVTGQGEANRHIGFASCLEDVLIKVSGLLRLAGDPRLDKYKANAASLVRDYNYRDEKGGKPKNDEQGTRDRSFVLTADFDEAGVNNVLTALGVKPWLSPRPVLGVFAEMEPGARHFVVASDSGQTDLQRQALLAAAAKRGMSVVIPDAATLAGVMADDLGLAGAAHPKLAAAVAGRGAEAVLITRLVWDDQELRWNTDWQLEWRGQVHRWQLPAVTFDEAFRLGIGGAAQAIVEQR
ncbi:MAG: DUF2066 domain-containing protein [Bradyrhizobium sp.]|nr:DUF2066 domain-containing protein [Bradyrhizobium sp.]